MLWYLRSWSAELSKGSRITLKSTLAGGGQMCMCPGVCVCECVFVQIFYSTVWPGRKTDLLTIIMGQSEPFRWCRWSLCTSSRLHYSVFPSAPSHPSLSTSDHPLSVLPPLCFVTSSRANHRFIKTGGEIEKTRKGRGIERDVAGSAD